MKNMIKTILCDWLGRHHWIDDEDAPFAGLLRIPVICSRCSVKSVIEIEPWEYSSHSRR